MGYAFLKSFLTTAALASRFASISALPYTFIVVEIWACRMLELHRIATQLSPRPHRAENFDRHLSNFELGLVLHFTKSRGDPKVFLGYPPASWCAGNAYPIENATSYRFSDYYLGKRREAAYAASRCPGAVDSWLYVKEAK